MDILASVGRRSWNNNSGEHLTIHSAVYNLTDKTVVWVPNENNNDPEAWFTFALRAAEKDKGWSKSDG